MINDTLKKIEQRIENAKAMKPENKDALNGLLVELKSEIDELSKTKAEQADSIAGFTEASAREAMREEQDEKLLEIALDGLNSSVREVEVEHPKLVGIVNSICHALSNLGI